MPRTRLDFKTAVADALATQAHADNQRDDKLRADATFQAAVKEAEASVDKHTAGLKQGGFSLLMAWKNPTQAIQGVVGLIGSALGYVDAKDKLHSLTHPPKAQAGFHIGGGA